MAIKHKYQSTIPDAGDSSLVQPSNWNDVHDYSYDPLSISANTTLDLTKNVVSVTTGTSTITVTLPTAVGNTGKFVYIKKVDAGTGTVVIATSASQTVDGQSTYTLVNQWQFIKVFSDGTNWLIIGGN